jgi:hypothetical protein
MRRAAPPRSDCRASYRCPGIEVTGHIRPEHGARRQVDLPGGGIGRHGRGAIAGEIGMSVQMVSRDARFADKTASARANRDRPEQRKLAGRRDAE